MVVNSSSNNYVMCCIISSYKSILVDFVTHIFLLGLISYWFYKHFTIKIIDGKHKNKINILYLVLLLAIFCTYLFFSNLGLQKLIHNSNIVFEVYNIVRVDINTFLGLLIVGLIFLTSILLLVRIIN